MGLNYIPISSKAKLPSALKQIDENFRQLAAENQTTSVRMDAAIMGKTAFLAL